MTKAMPIPISGIVGLLCVAVAATGSAVCGAAVTLTSVGTPVARALTSPDAAEVAVAIGSGVAVASSGITTVSPVIVNSSSTGVNAIGFVPSNAELSWRKS